MNDRKQPVEVKVKASTSAAAVAGVIVWLLQEYVLHGAVPEPLQMLVTVVTPPVCAFVAGWLAKHTPRDG
ncbi:hypothetical protein ACFY05_32095 [Microtetraspora fusca]|uniref:Holin n=1 Tax=Microtetraspora fusca TaxID=1997 RepID=A0ABW6VET3_MICFU